MIKTTLKIVETIAEKHLSGSLHIVPILNHGTVNQVFKVSNGLTTLIVRINDYRDEREFLKEDWAMRQAQRVGTSVAESLEVGLLEGFNFNVQTVVCHRNGQNENDQLSIWYFLGRQARKFHQIPVCGIGDILVDEKTSQFDGDWQKYLKDNYETFLQDDLSEELTASKKEKLRCRFKSLMLKDFNFGLCHGDLCPRNVVLDDRNSMSIIDWGCAHGHIVPHYDFIELLRDHSRDSNEVIAFMDGYGIAAKERDDLLDEAEIILTICHYDLVRWARDRSPKDLKEKKREFLALANLIS